MTKLTAVTVNALRAPGKYPDGHGLYLHVDAARRRYWVYRYQRDGRERVMSLGSAEAVSLAGARVRHARERATFLAGGDPLAAKQAAAAATTRETRSFATVAEQYIAAQEGGWRRPRLAMQWRRSLARHAFPQLGKKQVHDITVNDVLSVLEPIWSSKTETAHQLRMRIEAILSYAKARGWRDGENPAIWRGNLALMLPKRSKVRPVQHHPALDWRELRGFWSALRAHDGGMGGRALQFLILTAARLGEVRLATWDEIDLAARVWTIAPTRMKAAKEHRVPLSDPALAILQPLAEVRTDMRPDALVFSSMTRAGVPLADTTLKTCLRRLGHREVTVHGFRSTFRDWCADHGEPADLAEAALAHVTGNATVRAYARSDLFDRRRALMARWAEFVTTPPAEVVPLRVAG